MATIALCIPAFNAEKYLPALLLSAKNQLIPFDEIMVYNDCSTDNTSDVAKEHGAIVVEGIVNKGCSIGKNNLAKIAKSDWLHFHDADDDLLPKFTQVAHKWIDNQEVYDIILLNYKYKNFETQQLIGEPNYNIDDLKKDPIRFTIVNKVVNFAIIRKASFLNIAGFDTDPNVLYNEDRAFYSRAAIKGLLFAYEPELTCINYYYPGSMSSGNRAKCADATLHVFNKIYLQTGENYNKEIAEQLLSNATYAATAQDWETVKASVLKSKLLFPGLRPSGSVYFGFLYRLIPVQSFYIREMLLRYFTSKRNDG